ncbi:MAG: adenylate kinase [Candidatus Omnitrophica bacterium]|nr:adenylate kinase [Candidatus Omnitrophota bacterium]
MNLVLLGPPGAGKGTQAKVLSREFKFLHVSTGDMLREALKEGKEVGRRAKTYMDKGELVPDDIVIDIVIERISQEDAKKGFLLDGFPRNERQANQLDESLARVGKKVEMVLYFKTSSEVSIARLSGRRVCQACRANFHVKNMPPKKSGICDYCGGKLIQRNDDKEKTVKNRLVVYEKETESLIGYYKEKDILQEVSGDLDVDNLFEVIKVLLQKEGLK